MISSRRLRISGSVDDIAEVLAEVDVFATEMKLSKKDALRIRLLAEDTMAMLRTMTGENKFGIEFEGSKNECVIRLETDTLMSAMKKEELLSVSSTGKNIAAKGITGKIRDVFETAFIMPSGSVWTDYCSPSMMMGYPGDMNSAHLMDTVYWSLNRYKKSVDEDGDGFKEELDELERSIVSNLADDVQVGVRGDHVAMNIIYKLNQ